MCTLGEKIQNIQIENARLKTLKRLHRIEVRDFRCDGSMGVDEDEIYFEYYYFPLFPSFCRHYDSYNPCTVKYCPNRKWNNQYIDLLERIRAARRTRNASILNLFRVRKK